MTNENDIEFAETDVLEQDEQDLLSIYAEQIANDGYLKMDYSLETPEERAKLTQLIIDQTPPEKLTSSYLSKMADYICSAMTKEDKQKKTIITDNRAVTLNKHETSFEGLIGSLENGEDGIYSMIQNDKNTILTPKVSITKKDLEEIPELRKLVADIEDLEEQFKHARGKRAYALKKQIIAMRKDQYEIKGAFKKTIRPKNNAASLIKEMKSLDLTEHITIGEDGLPYSDGLISLFNEEHISTLLRHYSELKQESWDDFKGDIKWLMMDLDNVVTNALEEKYPLYYDLLIYKIDGESNLTIQELLEEKYQIKHTVEYISSLWRNKIPKLIAEEAKKEYLIWHYTFKEKGYWKKCSRCGQIKLGHNYFFSKNKTAKDGWYSICKECRNKKKS